MERVPIFMVEKFFPPRCPKCGHAFSSANDFAWYAGEKSASSFVEAKINQQKRFPELFGSTREATEGVWSFSDKFSADFIICLHCNNATLRIKYATRQVMTREEAVRLVRTQGFTCWTEGEAAGAMARPFSLLSILGSADLNRLRSLVVEAKHSAAPDSGEEQRGDAFESTIEPALVEIVNKARETQITQESRDRLHGLFGALWESLWPECRDFLVTAEVLKDDLVSLTETDPSIDFSPAVAMYSKALEKDVLERLFRPFANSDQGRLPLPTPAKADLLRSVASLQAFVAGGRDLTLGDMAFCLLNLGCKMRNVQKSGFAEFLRSRVSNLEAFCEERKFPGRLIEYVREYRNKSAHVARLSKETCMAARAFLLEEPVRLLIVLEESLSECRPSR